jgi:hypothetical protein
MGGRKIGLWEREKKERDGLARLKEKRVGWAKKRGGREIEGGFQTLSF